MHKKLYASCPKKYQARYKTIIEVYQDLFGKKIPKSRQYWTLCSQQVNELGTILSGSEREQLLQAGLIEAMQFHGVDRETHVIALNSKHLPDSKWFCDDFYTALSKQKQFVPSIINCDLIAMPKNGVSIIGDIISLLTRRKIRKVMVVANLVLKTRFKSDVGNNAIIDELNDNQKFNFFYNTGKWKVYKTRKIYSYEGTGLSRTRMGTIIFYR